MKGLSGFVLKWIAMITMVVDHVGLHFMNNMRMMRFIGRISLPIYAWFVAESVHATQMRHTEVSHAVRLFLLAVVSEIPYDLFFSGAYYIPGKGNVVFTIFVGYLVCVLMNRTKAVPLKLLILLAGCWVAEYFHFSYRFVGVLLIVAFDLLQTHSRKTGKKQPVLLFVILFLYVLYYVIHNARPQTLPGIVSGFLRHNWSQTGALISGLFLLFYNGKRGPVTKWFTWLFRLFYPLHLIFLLVMEKYLFL